MTLDVADIQRFYSGTESECRGRRLFVDFFLTGAGDLDPNSWVQKCFAEGLDQPATKAVIEDVARAFLEPAKFPRPFEVSEDVPEVNMWCAYHEHERFGEECYRIFNVDMDAQQRQLWLETNPNWREEMLSEMTAKQKRAWIEVEAAVSRPTSRDGVTTTADNMSLGDVGTASLRSEEAYDPSGDVSNTAPDSEPYHTPPRGTVNSDEDEKAADGVTGSDDQSKDVHEGLVQTENRPWPVPAHVKDAVISEKNGPISLATLANLELKLPKSDYQ